MYELSLNNYNSFQLSHDLLHYPVFWLYILYLEPSILHPVSYISPETPGRTGWISSLVALTLSGAKQS